MYTRNHPEMIERARLLCHPCGFPQENRPDGPWASGFLPVAALPAEEDALSFTDSVVHRGTQLSPKHTCSLLWCHLRMISSSGPLVCPAFLLKEVSEPCGHLCGAPHWALSSVRLGDSDSGLLWGPAAHPRPWTEMPSIIEKLVRF